MKSKPNTIKGLVVWEKVILTELEIGSLKFTEIQNDARINKAFRTFPKM